MHRLVFTALLCLIASASLFVVDAIPLRDQKTGAVAHTAPVEVESWQTDRAAYALAGRKLSDFSIHDRKTIDGLRNRWTILGVWTDGAPPPGEPRYAAALNSAVDQDPDLDLLIIHQRPNGALLEITPSWPVLSDDGSAAAALAPPSRPFYLLISPDLTIHAWRGALSTDSDGIKSVIRGVAEIRKKAAPH